MQIGVIHWSRLAANKVFLLSPMDAKLADYDSRDPESQKELSVCKRETLGDYRCHLFSDCIMTMFNHDVMMASQSVCMSKYSSLVLQQTWPTCHDMNNLSVPSMDEGIKEDVVYI